MKHGSTSLCMPRTWEHNQDTQRIDSLYMSSEWGFRACFQKKELQETYTAPSRPDPKQRQHAQAKRLGKASCSQLLMPFLAESTAGLQCSFIICPGEGRRDRAARCVRHSVRWGAVEIQGENPSYPYFDSRLCFRAA